MVCGERRIGGEDGMGNPLDHGLMEVKKLVDNEAGVKSCKVMRNLLPVLTIRDS